MKREWKGKREAGGCKKFRNIFTLRECTSVTRIACFETRPNVSHWPQKPSGDSASFVTEFTFCTRSQEHSRSEFIVANITFAFACTTNPACFEPSPFKTEIYPRIILAFSLNHFWRGVMLHIPATNETYKCNRVKKKRKKIEIFEIRVSFRVFLLADQLIRFSIFCLKPIFWNVSAILHRCG